MKPVSLFHALLSSLVLCQLYAIDTRLNQEKTTRSSLRGHDSRGILGKEPSKNSSKAVHAAMNSSIKSDRHLRNSSDFVAFNQDRDSEFPIMMHSAPLDPVLVRPSAGKSADKVYVGLIAKNFFGTNLKNNRFTIDIVLSIRWHDPRVLKLIPDGIDKLSMAWSQALKLVWMPGVVIANRDIEMYEIISSSVTIHRTGEVVRVERAQTRCLKKFQLQEYPFDTQDLEVRFVSSKYMTSEVVLLPNLNTSAVEENIWGLYQLMHWKEIVYEDFDGDLRKSRGSLILSCRRKIGKYFDDHLVPSFIVLVISWAVFYFPFANPFITPRLALSILALLQFTALMVKSSKELPGSAPFNWNDLFNQQIQSLMCATIILNICSEIIHHSWKKETLAKAMNHEAKVLIPFASVVNIFIVLVLGNYEWLSLSRATIITKASLAVFAFCYGSYVYKVWSKHESTDARRMSMGSAASRP